MQNSRTFRVFISSTFSDMKEERNALHEYVFPRLQDLCERHGCQFQAIDLRWGISEEAGLDQQTMKICLEEIARCQAISRSLNFIILMGDRYGWRPLPSTIDAIEFEEILGMVPSNKRPLLMGDERGAGGCKGWYRKDFNAVPPEYCLRSRSIELSENEDKPNILLSKELDYAQWKQVECELRRIFLEAIDKLGWMADDRRRIKYEASATHQEICKGVLDIDNASEHVFCFSRRIENRADLLDSQSHNKKDFVDLDDKGLLDVDANTRLERLRSDLKAFLTSNYVEYNVRWSQNKIDTDYIGKEINNNVKNLCADVYRRLSGIIKNYIDEFIVEDQLSTEIEAHELFRSRQAEHFVGRCDEQAMIVEYLKGHDRRPMIIKGDTGIGKTALMAYSSIQSVKIHHQAVIVTRFIGATPASLDNRALLEGICREISRCYNTDEVTLPVEVNALARELPNRMALASSGNPLIIYIDGLDQFTESTDAAISWIPAELPENVFMIISMLPGRLFDILNKRSLTGNCLCLKTMTLDEGRQLLDCLLENGHRALAPHQREYVLKKFSAAPLPLYLKLAFNVASKWKSYDTLASTVLSDDTKGIIRNLYAKLSQENNHGKVMVGDSLGIIAASRYGLTETEILGVLSANERVMTDFKKRSPRSPTVVQLPIIVWSRLYFDLKPYLVERDLFGQKMLTFYHRQLAEVAVENYLSDNALRACLADYFDAVKAEERRMDECPWQLLHGGYMNRLKDFVTDPYNFTRMFSDFRGKRLSDLMLYWRSLENSFDLVREYQAMLERCECSQMSHEKLTRIYALAGYFLHKNAKYNEACRIFNKELEIETRFSGDNNTQTIIILNNLASALHLGGNYNDAETIYRRALALCQKEQGEDHSYAVKMMNNLGLLLRSMGRPQEAISLFDSALEFSEKRMGPRHVNVALCLNNLALAYQDIGDYSRAEALCRRSLGIEETEHGFSHDTTATGYNNLGMIFLHQKKFDEALDCINTAWEIRKGILGERHPDTAQCTMNLAGIYIEMENYNNAEKLLKPALEIYESVLGSQHPETINCLQILTSLSYRREKNDKWDNTPNITIHWSKTGSNNELIQHNKAVEVLQEVFKKPEKDASGSLSGKGGIELNTTYDAKTWFYKGYQLSREGRIREAIECYDRVISLDRGFPYAWLEKGVCLMNLQKVDEAIRCFDQATDADPNLAIAFVDKGVCQMKMDRFSDALLCFIDAEIIDPDYPALWYNKGFSEAMIGLFNPAIESFEKFIKLAPPEDWAQVGEAKKIIKTIRKKQEEFSESF